MSSVVFASVRRAPGVSTAWLMTAMAAAVSGRSVVGCEADPFGNDMAVAFDLGTNPGLVTLASAARRGLSDPRIVDDHGRSVADSLLIVPGPVTAEESSSTVAAVATTLGQAAATDDRLWLFDVGRLTLSSPALPLARSAALTLLVCRPAPAEALSLPSRVAALSGAGCGRLGLVCVGKGAYPAAEIADYAGIGLVGQLPRERDADRAVASAVAGRGRHSLLWRAAVELASTIGWMLAREATADAPATVATANAASDHGAAR